jgi:hypothetical protein
MKLTHHEADTLLRIGAAGIVSLNDVTSLMEKDLVVIEQGQIRLTKRGKRQFQEMVDSDSYEVDE